ncbi:MAG: hypothetical protein LBS50_07510, partial [Prevotellaceae bacterium]|nr:hypothetical protein [Prevotellaceae bacterium]
MSNEMQLKLIETCSMVCNLFDKNPQWKLNWFDELVDTKLFADKIYIDTEYFKPRKKYIQLDLFTPV